MFLYIFWSFFAVLILMALGLTYKIAQTDMRRRIIPDGYLFPLLIIGVIVTTFYPWPVQIESGAVGMAFGYMLAAVVGLIFDKILTHKDPNAESPIGMGDIKLISVGGLWCGPTGLAIALVLACGFGATWAYRKKQKFIPFAPFFVIGGFLSLITITFLI
ncbi:MAG: prepilin peptidase [Alphaproteobacteria bacterium]|jgi:prepilin signal peptidase PulO-like enzyme (type II secretory pathway)|nr:prepilin peptidase [Alphaproteobacteria bacterium]